MFKTLLEIDTIRGPHSTGVAFVNTDATTKVIKKVGTPWEGLYDSKAFEDEWRKQHNVMIGHNRWATKGKVNSKNAHPFEFENIIGVHNGTLRDTSNLDDSNKFEVDSENLYWHMENNGVVDTIGKLRGAFALVWWNKEESTLNMCRNDERPLYYTLTDDRKAIVWASEKWMLEIASNYHDVKLNEIWSLPVGVHYKFHIPTEANYNYAPLEKCTTRKIELNSFKKTVVAPTGGVTKPTPTSSTVTPISKAIVAANKEAVGKPKAPAGSTEYIKRVNKFLEVYVDKAAKNSSGQWYIKCYDVDNDEVEVRVHAEYECYMWKKMMTSQNFFRIFAKSYSAIDGGHLSADLRAIEEIADASSDIPFDVTILKGHDGSIISPVVFAQRTEKGCAWCSGYIDEEDAETMVWIAKDDFICGDCKDLPEVKGYLTKVS